MKLISSITLVLCFVQSAGLLAQGPKPLPDSIRVEIPHLHSIVTFELRRYTEDKSIIREFPSELAELISHLRTSLTQNELQKPHKVVASYTSSKGNDKVALQLGNASEKTTLSISQKQIVELLPPGWEFTISQHHAQIHVYAPDLEQLETLAKVNLEPAILKLDNDPQTHQQERFGLISRVILDDVAQVQHSKLSHRLPNDMLALQAGAGVGLIRERFYPEVNATLSIYLANRYRENHKRISAYYDLKLFTGKSAEGEYLTQPAGFLSFGYAMNFSKDRPRWTGLGVGFLVHNRSDVYKGKTMKFFLETDIGSSKLNLIPELYLTNDFKEAVFGLKLNYKF